MPSGRDYISKIKGYYAEIKKIEEKHPDKSEQYWLRLAEYTIKCAKIKDRNREYGRAQMLKRIARLILEHVKYLRTKISGTAINGSEEEDSEDFYDSIDGEMKMLENSRNDSGNINGKTDPAESESVPATFRNIPDSENPEYKKDDIPIISEINPEPFDIKETLLVKYPDKIKKEADEKNISEVTPIKINKEEDILGGNEEAAEVAGIEFNGKIPDPFGPEGLEDIEEPAVEELDGGKSIETVFCPICGEPIKKGDKLCRGCGYHIE